MNDESKQTTKKTSSLIFTLKILLSDNLVNENISRYSEKKDIEVFKA